LSLWVSQLPAEALRTDDDAEGWHCRKKSEPGDFDYSPNSVVATGLGGAAPLVGGPDARAAFCTLVMLADTSGLHCLMYYQ
jgi:hypothetical protein